jgi:transposase-like protein
MDHAIMLTIAQVQSWVAHGGGWCPFCGSEQIKYVGTMRAINSLTTVKYFCQRCQKSHYALYRGDELVDLTHDTIDFSQ